jgi:hypothetical protein
MNIRIQVQETDDGEVFIELPEAILAEVGMKEGDLVEVIPQSRFVGGQLVENLLSIRKVRQ